MGERGKLPKNKLPANAPMPEAMESKKWEAHERRYKAEDALRTIETAERHKADKGLMKDVKTMAKEKMKALGKIC
jgi:hypothetical protein